MCASDEASRAKRRKTGLKIWMNSGHGMKSTRLLYVNYLSGVTSSAKRNAEIPSPL